ncbi:MAG: hypothetical protein UC300_02710 [Prevotella sp.]|nr:hypothetical protein [Prevotella sp.]
MSVLKENARLDKYLAQSLIKENEYTETYRVIDDNDNIYFLKLYILKKTPERLMDTATHEVYTIERCKKLVNENIVSFIDSGKVHLDCGECHYFVTNYFTGDVLMDKLAREGRMDADTALNI